MKGVLKILLAICFCFDVHGMSWTTIERTQIEPRETNSCEGRQTPGLICESCDLLSTCVKHSSGWVNIPVEACDTQNGFYCNVGFRGCSNTTGPCHPFSFEGNFPCTSHGIFPDPYDCQKYHMCYLVGPTLVSASVDCGNDKAYNPATGMCSLTIRDSICNENQFICLNAGDAHAWPMSPNIFYVCKATSNENERILYPALYRCNDGEIFDGHFCRAGDSPSIPIDTITDSFISKPTSGITPTTMAPDSSRICTEVGLFADTKDCRKYYYCSSVNGNLKRMECPTGSYFNEAFSSCYFGSC